MLQAFPHFTLPSPFPAVQDALAQPLGGNISAAERAELERRADAMRQAAARLQRVSAVRPEASSSSGPTLETIESGKHH